MMLNRSAAMQSSLMRASASVPGRRALLAGTRKAPCTGAARRSGLATLHCSASQGKLAVITGGNTGLGKDSALEMAKKGYSVVLACRSAERAEKAAEDIVRECKAAGVDPSVDTMLLDLANLASVKDFTSAFKSKYDKCDVLLNNAGVMAPPTRQLTADGFEMQIGVNHLGHFALTAGMLQPLMAAPAARIVNVSSVAHQLGTMNFDNLQSEGLFTYIPTMGWGAYGQSKLANLLFTYELHRLLRGAGILTVDTNAVHPGVVDTELGRFLPLNFYPIMKRAGLIISPEEGARGQIRLCMDPTLTGVSGTYFAELSNEGKPGVHEKRRSNAASYNIPDARRLWEMSEKLTDSKYDFTAAATPVAAARGEGWMDAEAARNSI